LKKIAIFVLLFSLAGCAPAPIAGEPYLESKYAVGSCWNTSNEEPSEEVDCSLAHDVYIYSVQYLPEDVDKDREFYTLLGDLGAEEDKHVMGMGLSPSHRYLRDSVDFIESQTGRICDNTLKDINPNFSPTLVNVRTWAILPEEEEWKRSNWVACGLYFYDTFEEKTDFADFWMERSNMTLTELAKNIQSVPNVYSWCALGEPYDQVSCLEEHNWATWPIAIEQTSGYPSGKYATDEENFDATKSVFDKACESFAKTRSAKGFSVLKYPSVGQWRAGVTEVGCTIKLS
jgi:hypothetical protein